MTNTELLTEPELTNALEAFFDTQKAYQKALDVCGWSMSLESFYTTWYNENAAEKILSNAERLTERAAAIAEALELGARLADFVAAGIDEIAADYDRARRRYVNQQDYIADAPRRAWAMAYNARLAEIDKQIKGAKIRRGRAWSKWGKNLIDYATVNTISAAIDGEIEALQARREIAAADRFESVAA